MISVQPWINQVMSAIEREALKTVFRNWKAERMNTAKDDDAFERFVIEQILKDLDPSHADIASGAVGGGRDGGCDGFYFVVDRAFVIEEDFQPPASSEAELIIIQSTLTPSFQEDRILKLQSFCKYFFGWQAISETAGLRKEVVDLMYKFRDAYSKLFGRAHRLKVSIYYVCQSEHQPTKDFYDRVNELKCSITEFISDANVEFKPLGCRGLLDAYKSNPKKRLVLKKLKEFTMPDTSVVCLSKVSSFAEFLNDGNGKLQTWLMEPNVRDYQGNTPVNKQIRSTLTRSEVTDDFWWLNNGVTILADQCTLRGDCIEIDNPEIVNGLQTSHEIFNARTNPALSDCHILVKIIVAPDDRTKDAIIKATNSQTAVNPVNLKATDPIQFDIEEKLKSIGLFYDRRKGKYRNKPIRDIVTIKALGQAIIAAYLQRPSDSRGRPETPLRNEKDSQSIFNENHGLDFFAACILLDRQCEEFVSNSGLSDDEIRDLRFYVTMLAAIELTKKSEPDASDIGSLMQSLRNPIEFSILQDCLSRAQSAYVALGATDKVAKGREMQVRLKEEAIIKFSPVMAQQSAMPI